MYEDAGSILKLLTDFSFSVGEFVDTHFPTHYIQVRSGAESNSQTRVTMQRNHAQQSILASQTLIKNEKPR